MTSRGVSAQAEAREAPRRLARLPGPSPEPATSKSGAPWSSVGSWRRLAADRLLRRQGLVVGPPVLPSPRRPGSEFCRRCPLGREARPGGRRGGCVPGASGDSCTPFPQGPEPRRQDGEQCPPRPCGNRAEDWCLSAEGPWADRGETGRDRTWGLHGRGAAGAGRLTGEGFSARRTPFSSSLQSYRS